MLSSLQKLVCEELDENLSFEELRSAFGIPSEVALNKLGITNLLGYTEKWTRYLKDYFHHVTVFDDMRNILVKLKEMGISIDIVT